MKRSIVLFSGVMFFVCSICAFAAENSNSVSISKLSVHGNGKIEVPADMFQVSLGVLTTAKSVEQAMESNSVKMHEVQKVLDSVGLSKKEYQTAGFSVNPVFSKRPKNASSEWERTIIGYEVNNAVEVNSTKLDIVGSLLQKATAAGANKIGDISFALSNPGKYRAEAINAAVNNAKSDAEALAQASGLSLVKILDISLNNFYMPNLRMANDSFAYEASSSFNDVPVNPGMIKVSVDVNIVYEVQPATL